MNKKKICADLVREIENKFGLKESMYIEASDFNLFKEFGYESYDLILHIKEKGINKDNYVFGDPFITLDKIENKYDLIVGDLPLGWQRIEWNNDLRGISIKERKNWLVLFKSLFLLSDEGFGIFVVEPAFIGTSAGDKLTNELNKSGFYINAIFNAPENIFHPETSIRPLIVIMSKNKNENLFVADLDENSDTNRIISNFKDKSTQNLQEGLFLPIGKFRGFNNYKISKNLDKLSEQYKEFKKYIIADISLEINLGKSLTPEGNSIYIPRVGNSQVIFDLKDAKLKEQNYIQIVVNKKIVRSEYLSLFFNTPIGRLSLQLLFSDSIIPYINKKDIETLMVPIPDIALQGEIVLTNQKFEQLKTKIHEFEKEIAFNPRSAENIENNLNNMLDSLNLLNEADKILSLIRNGESKILEFKSTLRKSIEKKGIPNRVIEKETLKTITGFMNSSGGVLLVGVNDKGEIPGLDSDGFKSRDDMLKHVKNLIRRDIGEEFYDLINYKIVSVQDKEVLMFECEQSDEPVFLGEKEFYVRTNPATDKLEGKKLIEYIKNHFKKVK
jgi:restriction endonuclease S subunit